MERAIIPIKVLAAVLCLLLAGTAALTATADGAKKRKKNPNRTRTFVSGGAQAIPDRAGADTFVGVLNSTIDVGKAMKGREVADVDVSFRINHPDLSDIDMLLIAPNGATVFLAGENDGIGGVATDYGSGPNDCSGVPTTFSDETRNFVSDADAVTQPGQVLSPWPATVQPGGFPLSVMDGGKARGRWTLQVLDFVSGDAGILGCWKLRIKPRAAAN